MSSWLVTVISDQDFLHIKLTGILDSQTLKSIAGEVISHFDVTRHRGMLLDIIEFETETSLGQAYFNSEKFAKAGFTQIPKWSLVNKPGAEKQDRFRELACQNVGINTRFFYSVEEAREWILDQE